MEIRFGNRALRVGLKSVSIYRLDANGNLVRTGDGASGDTGSWASLDRADYNSVVAGAVGWIAEQVKSTPIMLERTRGDEAEPVDDHDLLTMLERGIVGMSWRELLDVSVWDICATAGGSAYWRKVRNGRTRVDGLEYLPARRVAIRNLPDRSGFVYRYSTDGRTPEDITPEDIVHLRLAPDPRNPRMGRPPLRAAAGRIAIDDEAEAYTWWLLRNRGNPGLIGRPPAAAGVIPKDVADEAAEYLRTNSTGSNRGKTLVLRAAMELTQMGFNPSDMDLSALSNSTEERVCADLGISPLVANLGAGTEQSRVGAATVEISRDSWVNGVIPKQDAIMEQINRQLVPEFEPDGDYMLRFDRSGVEALQADMTKETARWSQAITSGWATVFDARDALELETSDNDRYYLRGLNVLPYPADTPAELLTPPQPEPDEPDADAESIAQQVAMFEAELERVKAMPPEQWNGMRQKAEAWE